MTDYNIRHTDSNIAPIIVPQHGINRDMDISLFGRNKLMYGESMNENLLHLLENFACPHAIPDPMAPNDPYGTPDLTLAKTKTDSTAKMLSNPINGQLWYDTTNHVIHVWSSHINKWIPLTMGGDITINRGVIANGDIIPLPISTSGYSYTRAECSWVVGYQKIDDAIDELEVYSSDSGVVTARYREKFTGLWFDVIAHYFIIGIRGNINLGQNTPPTCIQPSPTPSVTPTTTPTLTATPFPTESQAPAPTPQVLTASTIDYTHNVGTPLNTLHLYAHVDVNDGNVGVNCSNGTGFRCPVGRAAPTTLNRPNMRLIVEGGTPPYNVVMKYTSGANTLDSSECVLLGFDSTTTIRSNTTSNTILTTFTIPNEGGHKDSGTCVGACHYTQVMANGSFTFEIEDNDGTTLTLVRSWMLQRDQDSTPNPSQTRTPSPSPTPSSSRDVALTPSGTPTPTPLPSPTPTPAPLTIGGGITSLRVYCTSMHHGGCSGTDSCMPPPVHFSIDPDNYMVTGGDGNYTATAVLFTGTNPYIRMGYGVGYARYVDSGECHTTEYSNNTAYIRLTITDGTGTSVYKDIPINYSATVQ